MHASAVFVLAVTGLAAAQVTTSAAASSATSTTSSTEQSGCGTQIDSIIASCLGTLQAQLNACPTNDWDCLCTQTTNVLTCYDNCPTDPNRNGVLQQQTSYCNAAKAYGSSSSTIAKATASASGSAAPSSAASASVSPVGNIAAASSSPSGSSPSASPSGSGAVANVAYPSFLAAMLGLAVLF